MEATDTSALRERARTAYERGRFARAGRESAVVAPLIGISLVWGSSATVAIGVGLVLAGLTLWLRARGGFAGRAATTGLVAGVAPMLLPLVMMRLGGCCIGGLSCSSVCLAACVGGGVLAGALVGSRAISRETRPLAFIAVASAVAVLVGSLGCIMSGAAGVVGLAAALAASAIPVALVGRMMGSR
jgi:hypothetical protein